MSAAGSYPCLFDTSQLASERDPTRTLSLAATGSSLVDTTADVIDSFDTQGRLIQRNLRTGEPVFAVTYSDATTDRVASITDPEGGATTFGYSGGRLSSIQDPAGRTTLLDHDSSGDLRSITQPDGETLTFAYQSHHMTSKTARGSDTTSYTYNSDGTLSSATKPNGETTTLVSSSLSTKAPQYDIFTGMPTYSGQYIDAHGVEHTFATDPAGQIQTDSYTADGVQYSYVANYYGNLDPTGSDPFARANTLYRISDPTLNGIPIGLSRTFDSLGRLTAMGAASPHTRQWRRLVHV